MKEEYLEHLKMQKEIRQDIIEKLKECKDSWLENNAKGQPSLGVSTVQQILDAATGGLWDFSVEHQWREEVSRFDKKMNQYMFDGYVYHVRGTLHIEGLGKRTQYGSKVAVGGKDNQNSSYKSAASDCLKKCASLFGVGSSVYSKIKIETEEDRYVQQQQQYQQPAQQQQPQTFVNAEGLHQNGDYVYYNNNWIHMNEYHAMKQQITQPMAGGQYPSLGQTYDANPEQHYQQNQYQEHQYQQPQQSYGAPVQQEQQLVQEIAQADHVAASGAVEYPFENVPVQQDYTATPQYEANPQPSAVESTYSVVQNEGVPVQEEPKEAPQEAKDPLADVVANNPWNTIENQMAVSAFKEHRTRLNIQKDADLIPYIRDFFKDEKATIASITPETLVGFNNHLLNIAV